MKLVVVLLLFYSFSSLAKTRVGEWVAYDFEETTATSSFKGILLKEIVEEKIMRSPQGRMIKYVRVSHKLDFESEPKESSEWVPESEYLSTFDLNVYMLKCRLSTAVGTLEKVIVKAGPFNSCRVKGQDTWVGVVPFGHVLHIFNDGKVFRRYELLNFSWSKKPGSKF